MAKEDKQDVIMVRPFTKPDDVHGMIAARGVLTSEGGATSHAAVVARQFGIPCVVGASAIKVDLDKRIMTAKETVVREGDWISVDGGSGQVFIGKIPMTEPSLEEQVELMTLLKWADEICARPGMRSAPKGWPTRGPAGLGERGLSQGRPPGAHYGAMGIGLCRTEHMFFEPERLPVVQRMILAGSSEERTAGAQRVAAASAQGLRRPVRGHGRAAGHHPPDRSRRCMSSCPPRRSCSRKSSRCGSRARPRVWQRRKSCSRRIRGLHESNPMMGLRGVRLSIAMPEIVEMQVRAIFEAAADCTKRGIAGEARSDDPADGHREGTGVDPAAVDAHCQGRDGREGACKFPYKFGTMIEIPRAAVTAAEVAKLAEFFSFGTNDLTQMTFGYSRDDAERNFLVTYVEQGILPVNPFQTLDRDGVGRLMQMAIEDGRTTRPDLEVGICGEHGGDPDSIEWCHMIGNNYVSCSPFRVPIARLAAAQAALKHRAPAGVKGGPTEGPGDGRQTPCREEGSRAFEAHRSALEPIDQPPLV